MRRFCYPLLLLLLAGCGSDGNVRAITPVMADTRGTYRLAAASDTVTAPDGTVSSVASPAVGTLRLTDTGYSLTVYQRDADLSSGSLIVATSNGSYVLGASVNTILNSREGSFALSSVTPPSTATGTYLVTPDFTITLKYNPSSLPDHSLVARSQTWVKESDSPRQ